MNHATSTANHSPFAATYADATARLAATGFERQAGGGIVAFDADDVGKFARQSNDNSVWQLIDDSPITWQQIDRSGLASTNISDFNEAVEDRIGAKVIPGTGINVSYNDTTGETTISNTDTGSGSATSDEHIQDVVGAMLADGDVDFTYDDTGNTETNIVRKASENFALPGTISPSQLTANTNDWNPTGWSTAVAIRFSTDASRNITGLAGGAAGRFATLLNIGSQNAVIKDEDGSSTAANRFALSADLTIGADQAAVFWYDNTSSRWRLLAGPAATSSGYTTVQDEGSSLTARSTINFTGPGVNVTDDGTKTVVNVPTPGGALTDPLGIIMEWQVCRVNGTRTTFGADGNALETGSSGAGSDSDGMWCSWTSATSLNAEAGLAQSGGGDMTQLRYFPIIYFKIKTGTPTTELRFFLGLVSTFTFLTSDTPAQSYVAFRFSTTASDTNWKCVADNASGSPTVVDSGVAYAANTVYTMKIDCSNPASVKFYINGNLVGTITTTLPSTSTSLAWFARVRNTGSTTAKVFLANRMVLSMP